MLEDIKVFSKVGSLSSVASLLRLGPSFFFMRVLIIPLVLIRHKNNGKRYLKLAKSKITLYFSISPTCLLPLAIQTKMPGRYVILSNKVIKLRLPSLSPRTSDSTVSVWVHFRWFVKLLRRRNALNLNSRFLCA